MSLKILYVEPDTAVVDAHLPTLAEEGFQVVHAASGVKGLAAARTESPDLVLSEVELPDMTGWNFIRLIRAEPQFAFMPVLFLTKEADESMRIRGFRLGADDVIQKPVEGDDLAIRMARVLADGYRIEQEVRRRPSDAGMHGPLADVGLSTLLTIFEVERMGGVLTVRRADPPEVGRIYLRGGFPIRARLDAPGAPRNRDAIYAMLRWGQGEFDFRGCYIAGDNEIEAATMHLLIEGARQLDERREAEDAADAEEDAVESAEEEAEEAAEAAAAADAGADTVDAAGAPEPETASTGPDE